MFTGIVTAIGRSAACRRSAPGSDMRLVIATPWPDAASIPLGASIACAGCCLTAVEVGPDWFAVDVSGETLSKTGLGRLDRGQPDEPGALAAGRRRTGRPLRLRPCRRAGEVVSVAPEAARTGS